MNFNGTCGIWRKQSIIECGLWDGNILAEDLDLSYRMYMKNWQSAYSDEIICEGEIPNSIFSYKQQQYRWAKGTMQSARKNFLPIMKSKNLSRNQKIESIFHHFGYLLHLTIFVNFLLLVPLLFFSSSVLTSEIGFFFFVINMMAGSMYFVTANKLGLNLSTTIKSIVKLSLLNAGISWKTSMASLAGLLYNSGEFKRTPKGTTTKNSDYVIHFKFDLLIEFGLIIYLLSGIYFAIINQNFIPGLYLVFCFSSVIIVFYYTVNETF
jgi:cellulose synthase/poly-beta-1,6-N-acetylglucosamine synthase-like glycosyltransferase